MKEFSKETRRTAYAWLVCACAMIAWTPQARAQEKDAVTDSARRRFQEGVRAFDRGRYEEARAAFLQAYALKHHPAVLLNLAQSEVRSQHFVEAARHFSGFLRESTNASAPERADAEKGLALARSKIGRIQASVDASGAAVSVDGETVGESPLAEPVDVPPGAHTVEARLGQRSASVSLTAPPGRLTTANLTLEPTTAAASAEPLPVPAPVPAAPAAVSPTPQPAPVGAKRNPDATEAQPQTSKRALAALPTETPQGAESGGFFAWVGDSPFAWVSLGVTVAGLGTAGVAGYFAHQANDNVNSVDSQIQHLATLAGRNSKVCGPPVQAGFDGACSVLRDNMNKRDTDVTVAIVGLAAAGAGAIATVTGYLLRSTPSTARVVPQIGPQTAGIGVFGSF